MERKIDLNCALDLHNSGNIIAAKKLYDKILAADPNNANALHLLGLAEHQSFNHKTAEIHISKALKIYPKSIIFMNNYGQVLESLNRTAEAIEYYYKVIKLKPEYQNAKINFINAVNKFLKNTKKITAKYKKWLVLALNLDNIDHSRLSHAASNLIALEFDSILDNKAALMNKKFINDELLLLLLSKANVSNFKLEKTLTSIRKDITLNWQCYINAPITIKKFLFALSKQLFINDYIFAMSIEEGAAIEELQQFIIEQHDAKCNYKVMDALLIVSLYKPLAEFYKQNNFVASIEYKNQYQQIANLTLFEPLQEQEISSGIKTLSSIQQSSSVVKQHYEDYPYPRWQFLELDPKNNVNSIFTNDFPFYKLNDAVNAKPNYLIAGCGTGWHPLNIALNSPNANITAIDISKASLSYAMRMQQKLKISNINFYQADILNLECLHKKFDVIESVGVLHHLKVPLDGFRALLPLLNSGGLLRIGLYSSNARASIMKIKNKYNITSDKLNKKDFDAIRYEIAESDNDDTNSILNFRDFFNSSECRDLLFHMQEHCYTILEIKAALKQLNLNFIGFEIENKSLKAEYSKQYPEDKNLSDLDNWHQFEQQHPNIFRGMYIFWCALNE